ncbi:MAG TPA: choice-of-anchor tandem repeat GloVer-containing protein, partial [Chthonomonadaceae bacterium]|nr:choice-of-anchor tandem repeat GloVer-containing protein [Chthonomonadaceae bacterium]
MFQALKPKAKALFGALALLCLPLAGAQASDTILKDFSTSYTNGAYPIGQLVFTGGSFYGVTQYGVSGNGDIFKMSATGAVTILHELNNGNGDGYYPNAGMVLIGSKLYGTTLYGGPSGSTGVLFSINTNGTGYTVLHGFTGYNSGNPPASDGSYVYAGLLVASDGNLYGA